MTGQEMNDEFDLLYDAASEEAPGLDTYEKSMFLSKGMYEVVVNRYNEYIHRASRGFHDDELNRDALKGFIASAVQELTDTPVISDKISSAENISKSTDSTVPLTLNNFDSEKIEPTTDHSYFFHHPSDSMGLLHEQVVLRPIDKLKDKKLNKDFIAQVVPLRYDFLDRENRNPFMKPQLNLVFRLQHSDYDGRSMSEIVCDPRLKPYLYKVKYVKRPYPIILKDLNEAYPNEDLTIEGFSAPYVEPRVEKTIRQLADRIRYPGYKEYYDKTYATVEAKYAVLKATCLTNCTIPGPKCDHKCELNFGEQVVIRITQELSLSKFPDLIDLTFEEVKDYIVDNTVVGDPNRLQYDLIVKGSQSTNIDITIHHDIVQRGVELAIRHYRENTLANNMQSTIKKEYKN